MALPAPIATLHLWARKGGPMLLVLALTLLLGWSALQEGTRGLLATGVQVHADASGAVPEAALPDPEPAGRGALHPAACVPETSPDSEPATLLDSATRCGRGPWVARVPLWRADALRWQRPEPSLRLNPGHAPPTS